MKTTKVTATYQMINTKTGTKHSYYAAKREYVSLPEIEARFKKQLSEFPAYLSGLFRVASDILVYDYKDRVVGRISLEF